MLGALQRRSSYYVTVATASFCIGAAMELFMIQTGFYDKVTMIEAEERRERLAVIQQQQQLQLQLQQGQEETEAGAGSRTAW